jgi:hypothetical protein
VSDQSTGHIQERLLIGETELDDHDYFALDEMWKFSGVFRNKVAASKEAGKSGVSDW